MSLASLVRKLEQFVRLSPVDHVILNRASTERVRHFAPRVDIVREGEKPKDVHLILSGWADRKSTRLNSSHMSISYAVFCLKKKKNRTLKEITKRTSRTSQYESKRRRKTRSVS